MKIHGSTVPINTRTVVFKREGVGDIVFKVEGVLDYSLFDRLCPEPEPPLRIDPKGVQTPDIDNKAFKVLVDRWAERKGAWTKIMSLAPTEGLEFDAVDLNDVETWTNIDKEIAESGLLPAEIMVLNRAITDANGFSQANLEAARESFLSVIKVEEDQPPSD